MPRISDDKCPGEGLQLWLEAEEMQDRCGKVLVFCHPNISPL